ncbi:MAG: hypothetical protein KKG75_04895, partial [Nanoarchaeota archaeon]|nr:hypothetical protein [Nanoarchaeota archaeon]
NRKGQTEQIFVWIFVLILAVSILFFGVKIIRQGEDLKDEVLLVDFFKNLERGVNDFYYLDIWSSGTREFLLPNGVKEVCFTNITGNIGGSYSTYLTSLSSYSNVFVFPETEFRENRYNVTNFVVLSNPECVPVSGGRLKIKLKNIGRFVEIQK